MSLANFELTVDRVGGFLLLALGLVTAGAVAVIGV